MLLCPPYHPHNLLLLLAFLCVSKGQDVSPILIETCATESLQVSVTVPEAPTLQPVDVLFLFDDTGKNTVLVQDYNIPCMPRN